LHVGDINAVAPGAAAAGGVVREWVGWRSGRYWQILLQKSKIAEPRIFRENLKRESVADSPTVNRVAEVAREF
jgi:hypothetical protein